MYNNYTNEFNSTKFGNTYLRIIENAKMNNRSKINGLFELHHILPKAKEMFPHFSSIKENPWNGVLLTLREHFICHGLLVQHYRKTGETVKYRKMSRAFFLMSKTKHINSRLYEYLKLDLLQGVGSKPQGFNAGSTNGRAKKIYFYNAQKELVYESYGNFKNVIINNKLPLKHFNSIFRKKIYSNHPDFINWCLKTNDTTFEEIEINTVKEIERIKNKPKYIKPPCSDESIQRMKVRQKGYSIYKDGSGMVFRVKFDDPRVLSGELISIHTGSSYKNNVELINKRKNAILGLKNPAAKKIVIYNADNEDVFICEGSFEKVCKDNKLPFTAFRKSYLNNGTRLYADSYGFGLTKIINNGNIKYQNWYAKIEN